MVSLTIVKYCERLGPLHRRKTIKLSQKVHSNLNSTTYLDEPLDKITLPDYHLQNAAKDTQSPYLRGLLN